ncbi:helix-turn-helix domain-containing protein [Nocardia sp. IFM 10818]
MNTVVETSLSAELARKLHEDEGIPVVDIARMFNVSRTTVYNYLPPKSEKRTPYQEALEQFPWEVPTSMRRSAPYYRMREHGEFMATNGKGMSEGKLERLRSFWKKLRDFNLVLEFDPSLPKMPGVAPAGGFAFVPRKPEDKNRLIRVNEHTKLTPEGELIWVLPKEEDTP